MARDAADRRDLRARRRLRLRRHAQARARDLRADARAARPARAEAACSSTTSRSTARRARERWRHATAVVVPRRTAPGDRARSGRCSRLRRSREVRRGAQFSEPSRSQQYELDALARELVGSARVDDSHGSTMLQRLLLRDAGVERVLAAEARGDLQRLAAVLAERAERRDQEVLVRDRACRPPATRARRRASTGRARRGRRPPSRSARRAPPRGSRRPTRARARPAAGGAPRARRIRR